jgi:MSHA pilin protein MshC
MHATAFEQRRPAVAMKIGQSGFTLVELVVTIVVLGIIAVVAMPRFAARNTFDSRGFYDRATATVRYAQKLAIAQRRPIFVCVNTPADHIRVASASGCAAPLSDISGVTLDVPAPSGVTLTSSATEFSFLGGLGQTSAQVTITLNSTIGDPARSIVVENETGYVHPGP